MAMNQQKPSHFSVKMRKRLSKGDISFHTKESNISSDESRIS